MAEKHIIDPDGDCVLRLQRVVTIASENKGVTGEDEGARDLDIDVENANTVDDDSTAESSKALTELHDVVLLVSSKHMMLASPVFKAMFQHRFREGEELHQTGMVVVSLPEDNPDKFLMLVNIIHCRGADVPLKISPEDLCDLAILVDKYEMHSAVKFVSNVWVLAWRKRILQLQYR
ncbi:hypothetical protein DSL72_005206 [Monilinia vaccinii-corymbosi]|uniref:BTB domain-containing protein n=1 Tax=Monilinia vaccinii-corymbosi TaxID=61207 RepID=A0A8A3PER2_9HELO|nr:hypothetical protein DSL72_005206 [Monilinia vaccinii-corymbosi]